MRAKDVYYLRGERDVYYCVELRPKMMNDHRRLREATATTERRCGPRGQVQCGEVSLEWGTGRSSCEPESRQPAILSTHGSGRARGERAERGPWAGAQSLQYVVSSIRCARQSLNSRDMSWSFFLLVTFVNTRRRRSLTVSGATRPDLWLESMPSYANNFREI